MKEALLIKLAIFALEKLAKYTTNKLDDEVVKIVKDVLNPQGE